MLPIATSTSAYTLQPPLVNTTIPGTETVHVPYDNVAPSVSTPQADNNAKGNSAPPQKTEQENTTSPENEISADNNAKNTLAAQTTSAQSSFIAQLVGQGASGEATAVLQKETTAENRTGKIKSGKNAGDTAEGVEDFAGDDTAQTQSAEAPQAAQGASTQRNTASNDNVSDPALEAIRNLVAPRIAAYQAAYGRINALSTPNYTTSDFI